MGVINMIYLVLDYYIKMVKPKYNRFLIIPIFFLVLVIVFMLLASLSLWFCIGIIISLMAFFISLSVQERHNRKRISERYKAYNDDLNKLVGILSSFSYLSSGNNITWYNSDRVKYLIKMCDLMAYENVHKTRTSNEFLKSGFIAVLSFGAGVFAEKASLETNLQIIVIAIFLILTIYSINELIKMIDDFLFKSNSIEIILKLKYSLMDLLMRDFPDSAELGLEVETIK